LTKTNKIAAFIFLFFLTIGLFGFFTSYNATMKQLSHYNLFLTFGLLTLSFKNELVKFTKAFGFIFLLGYSVELIGANSGYIFGDYSYSNNLGISLFNVPIIIGINWATLSFGSWNLCKKITSNIFLNILIASLLMVTFDFCMEPTAIELGYWKWDNGTIPFYNYFSWFIISIPAIFICSRFDTKTSGISKIIFISQLIFFIILSTKKLWY
jgi:putative membrane protein